MKFMHSLADKLGRWWCVHFHRDTYWPTTTLVCKTCWREYPNPIATRR